MQQNKVGLSESVKEQSEDQGDRNRPPALKSCNPADFNPRYSDMIYALEIVSTMVADPVSPAQHYLLQ